MRFVDDIAQDVGFATRTLLRKPVFLVGTLSLALAVGATTGVYATADWLLRTPMGGVAEPDELVTLTVYERDKPGPGPFGTSYGFSLQQVREFGAVQDGFSDWAAYGKISRILSDDRGADEVVFEFVTGGFFRTLGARPALGRLIGPEDDSPGRPLVAVISYGLWQSRYGGDSDVVGELVRINGRTAEVVGVLSSDFEDLNLDWNGPAEVWIPVEPAAENQLSVGPAGTFWPIIGRVQSGLTIDLIRERAQAWLQGMPPVRNAFIEADAIEVNSTGSTRVRGRDQASVFLESLIVVCFLVLLAACFNVANIFLGRAITRRRELALRSALGAGRGRILQHLVTESVLVGLCASALGVAVGLVIVRMMAPLPQVYLSVPSQAAPIASTATGSTLVRTAVLLGLVTSILFGLVPAILGMRRMPMSVLRQSPPSWTWAGFRLSLRQISMALQVALSVTLAITAGLYAMSFRRVADTDPGYPNPDS
jgi:predicted permease